MNETLNKILQIIDWYRGVGRDYNDIDNLIYSRKQLSAHAVDFSVFVGDLKAEYETAYFNRKLAYAKAIQKNEGTVAEKEAKSIEDIQNVYKDEKELEGQQVKAKLILHQVNEVLSSMQQHLSYLKDEKRSEAVRQTT